MKQAPGTTLEALLQWAFGFTVEGQQDLIIENTSGQETKPAIPQSIFDLIVKDFEVFRNESEEVLKKYNPDIDDEFIKYAQAGFSFIPSIVWAEASMLLMPFINSRPPARVIEIAMQPKPVLENNVVDLNAKRIQLEEQADAEELELTKQKLKNPTIHMVGETWLVVQEDGKNCYITEEKGNDVLAKDITLSPLEYQLVLTCDKLERQVLWLREKYEPNSIDWDKEPSHGISQWAYEPDSDNVNGGGKDDKIDEIIKYEEWRTDFAAFYNDLCNVRNKHVASVTGLKVRFFQGEATITSNESPLKLVFSYKNDIKNPFQINFTLAMKFKEEDDYTCSVIYPKMKYHDQRLALVLEILATSEIGNVIGVLDSYNKILSE